MDVKNAEMQIDRIEALIDSIKLYGGARPLAPSYKSRIASKLGLVGRNLARAKSGIIDASLAGAPIADDVAQTLADVAQTLADVARSLGIVEGQA